MKLAIISHTEHYKTADGTIVGWSPTVNEINHLLDLFDEIYHVAMLYNGEAPLSTMAYKDERIKFVRLPSLGGQSIKSKLGTLLKAPEVIHIVNKTLKEVDIFQLRAPTGIGVYLIPYLTLFSKKKGWYKYAGNWNQKHPPLGYRLQRWMLKKQSRKVTINGAWEDQHKHCITFENPCLTLQDIEIGENIVNNRKQWDKLTFCFVGRLEKEKGVERIIKTIDVLPNKFKKRIGAVHLVGDGEDKAYFKTLSEASGVAFIFHGFLSRQEVFEIYKRSHVFLMPTTASEGFPKVIAEAMNFGCIPVVSDISSISQYIKHNKNGFVLKEVSIDIVKSSILNCLNMSITDYKKMHNTNSKQIKKFTFQYYNQHLERAILN